MKYYLRDTASKKYVLAIGCEWEVLVDDIKDATYWLNIENAQKCVDTFERLFEITHKIHVRLAVEAKED